MSRIDSAPAKHVALGFALTACGDENALPDPTAENGILVASVYDGCDAGTKQLPANRAAVKSYGRRAQRWQHNAERDACRPHISRIIQRGAAFTTTPSALSVSGETHTLSIDGQFGTKRVQQTRYLHSR